MQNQLPVPQPLKSFGDAFGDALVDAIKEIVPVVYDQLWQVYSPRTYSAFQAAKRLEAQAGLQGKPVLNAFVSLSAFAGAAEIGSGVARSLQVSNPPYAKSRKKLKGRRRPHA